ncbi:MAG: bifunctional hydroxymethylpyrimidine kinase/phosphomethylpyrimidine kinase [Alicyclobacillus sp.]|nr:bifunctional hydroxymethylpyrimidine kinase/phosphomethylpyrimidine kinase [Alicyclobacillus sp.]
MDSVLGDIGADAIKTGMLGSAEIIGVVAGRLEEEMTALGAAPRTGTGAGRDSASGAGAASRTGTGTAASAPGGPSAPARAEGLALVVDPVMIAKGGEALIDADAVATLRQRLLPLARVVTPNIPEAEALAGFPVDSWAACHQAAEVLHRMGPRVVVIKGGHSQERWLRDAPWDALETEGHAVDIVFDGARFTYLATPRVHSRKTHGTGCTFSSAIAAGLAIGWTETEAIATAKAFIYQAIASATGWDVGAGHGPTDHSVRPQRAEGVTAGGAYRLADGRWKRLEGGR